MMIRRSPSDKEIKIFKLQLWLEEKIMSVKSNNAGLRPIVPNIIHSLDSTH